MRSHVKHARTRTRLRARGPAPAPARPAENDIEMLQLAALGVAMGNAGARVKAVARAVVGTNDEDGVAQAIEAHVLAPRRARA